MKKIIYLLLLISIQASAQVCTLTVNADKSPKAISDMLFGIFFEDLSYAADGGLYAELVQNRSFEYSTRDNTAFTPLSSWSSATRGGATATLAVQNASPLNANNRNYLAITITNAGSGVGVMNAGYDGIDLTAGATYKFSFFAKRSSSFTSPILVQLENTNATVYGTATISEISSDWVKYSGTIVSNATNANSRLVILTTGTGTLYLDMVSLFPSATFKNRSNGMRADIAQKIADIKPKFVRFPGGCLVHGNSVDNIYKWKNTVGPIEKRKEDLNIWKYHQSFGLGFYEYFQFCEDIGAKPIPVVAAGVSCQFPDGGTKGISLDSMKQYVRDILDLVEFANGDSTTTWGKVRLEAGHAKPFNLEILCVGNEDYATTLFKQRFTMIYDSLRKYYPKLTICGTSGPFASGTQFTNGWDFSKQMKLDMVDEHYYQPPSWFLSNTSRYDSYSREGPKVYVGEYASQGKTVNNAIAEAAYMTNLERNGDIVRMASYAPLLANNNHVSWDPDLIYFNNATLCATPSYYVQQMFGTNQGDAYISSTVRDAIGGQNRFISAVKDSKSGATIIKIVNVAATSANAIIKIQGIGASTMGTAQLTVLKGNASDQNSLANPTTIVPVISTITVSPQFSYSISAMSLSVIRILPPTQVKRDDKNESVKVEPSISIGNGIMQLRFNNSCFDKGLAHISMVDVTGRECFTAVTSAAFAVIPLKNSASGVHIVTIKKNGAVWSKRINVM